jgi:hypothetical protein
MYKLIKNTKTGIVEIVEKQCDGYTISIPFNSDNTDYQAYLKWVAEGNTPEAAE